MWLLVCEDEESVSYYRRCGALTALLINTSNFPPPSWQREAIIPAVAYWITEFRCARIKTATLLNEWWAHGGVKRKGRWGTYPLQDVFTKVASPPDQSWFTGRGWGGGRQGSSLTFCTHQQRQTGAEPLNTHTSGSVALSLNCRSLLRPWPGLDPDEPVYLSVPSVCFLGRTDRQTYRNLRLLPRKARWI